MSFVAEFLENESVKPIVLQAKEMASVGCATVKDLAAKAVIQVCNLEETCAHKISRSTAQVGFFHP